jgi:hypothetical protein
MMTPIMVVLLFFYMIVSRRKSFTLYQSIYMDALGHSSQDAMISQGGGKKEQEVALSHEQIPPSRPQGANNGSEAVVSIKTKASR